MVECDKNENIKWQEVFPVCHLICDKAKIHLNQYSNSIFSFYSITFFYILSPISGVVIENVYHSNVSYEDRFLLFCRQVAEINVL